LRRRCGAPDGGRVPQQPWQKRDVGACGEFARKESPVDGIIYLVGLIVIVMAILSFIGIR
jgi:hypothetical protein